MIQFDVDKLRDCFCQKIQWTLPIGYQLSAFSVLDLDRIHHLQHALLQETDSHRMPDWNEEIPNTLRRNQSGGDY